MALVAVNDPGLLVLPTRRVIAGTGALDTRRFLAGLAADFAIEPVERDTLREAAAAATLPKGDCVALGVCLDGAGRYLLRLKDPAAARRAAFVLNPTGVGQVWSTAVAGATMPQESTCVFPRMLTGLVIHPLNDRNPREPL